jgi:hypothetical protein
MAAHLGQPYAKNETSGAGNETSRPATLASSHFLFKPNRRDFVHCVVCTRGCICICFGAGRATQKRPAPNPTGLRTLRCVYAWLHMHMLRGRTRHAKTPCPQPDGTSYTALCVRVAAYAYASGQDAPRKDALPPTRRDFVHCVVCTRGCMCICFGAGRATHRRPAPNPTGLRTLRCVYGLVFGHFGPFFPRSILFRPLGDFVHCVVCTA